MSRCSLRSLERPAYNKIPEESRDGDEKTMIEIGANDEQKTGATGPQGSDGILKQMMKKTLVLIMLLALGAGCDSGWDNSEAVREDILPAAIRKGRPDLDQRAPGFSLVDLRGKRTSLDDYSGKVVLLNFWATWCGPCRVEMPSMEALYRELKDEGFEILAISSDPQGMVVTRPFSESHNLTFPILHDAEYDVSGVYGVRTLPMSFLVDRRGILRYRVFGARDWNSSDAREIIRNLLKES